MCTCLVVRSSSNLTIDTSRPSDSVIWRPCYFCKVSIFSSLLHCLEAYNGSVIHSQMPCLCLSIWADRIDMWGIAAVSNCPVSFLLYSLSTTWGGAAVWMVSSVSGVVKWVSISIEVLIMLILQLFLVLSFVFLLRLTLFVSWFIIL